MEAVKKPGFGEVVNRVWGVAFVWLQIGEGAGRTVLNVVEVGEGISDFYKKEQQAQQASDLRMLYKRLAREEAAEEAAELLAIAA